MEESLQKHRGERVKDAKINAAFTLYNFYFSFDFAHFKLVFSFIIFQDPL